MERFVRANHQVRFLELFIEKLSFSKLLEMISGHTLISKLRLIRTNPESKRVKRNLLMRFAREHRMVVELDFFQFLLKPDDVIAVIRELNSLKYFRFRLKDRTEYHHLVNRLQQVVGFICEAKLDEGFVSTIVELKFNR